MSRTRASIWNFLSSIGVSGITMLLGLVSMPILLDLLGNEKLGAYRTVADWYALFGMIELGLAQSFRAVFAEVISDDSEITHDDVLTYGTRIYLRLAGILAAATLVLAGVIPWLVPVSAENTWDLRLGVLCFVPLSVVFPLNIYLYIADARQRGYQVNLGLTLQSVFIIGLSILFAFLGYGIFGQCVAFSVGHLPLPIAMRFLHQRHQQNAKRSSGGDTQEIVKGKLNRLNTAAIIMQLTGKAGLETDKILVAMMLGASSVIPFFATQRLIQLAQHQVLMLGNASWAALAELYHKGELQRFNQRLNELTSYTAVLALAFCVSTGIFVQDFVHLWVGEENFGGWLLVVAAMVIGYVHPVIAQWKWAFGATSKSPQLVRLNLYWVAVNIAVSIGATFVWGLAGPLIGTAISTVLVLFLGLPFLMQNEFGIPRKQIIITAIKPLLVAVPYGIFVGWLSQFRHDIGWIELAFSMAATCGGFLIVCWFLIWDSEIRAIWSNRVLTLVRNQRQHFSFRAR